MAERRRLAFRVAGHREEQPAIVTLEDLDNDEKLTYMLVSPEEASYEENKISIYSPIGKGLLGHKVGEVLEIKVPAGTLKYKVKKIKRPS